MKKILVLCVLLLFSVLSVNASNAFDADECISVNYFNSKVHHLTLLSCSNDAECQRVARENGKNPGNYVCTIVKHIESTGVKKCKCSEIMPTEAEMPVVLEETAIRQQTQVSSADVQAAVPRGGTGYVAVSVEKTETSEMPTWAIGVVLLSLAMLLALIVFMQHKHQ